MRSIVESIYLTYIYQSSCGHVKALHALGKKNIHTWSIWAVVQLEDAFPILIAGTLTGFIIKYTIGGSCMMFCHKAT